MVVFTLGAFLMRSAGCTINDIADRHIDIDVPRTKDRPLAAGQITVKQAGIVFAALIACALILVLLTNRLTLYLSLLAVILACCYPLMKRWTHLPQVVLGAAFSMSIPMAFAAQTNEVTPTVWLVFTTNVLWTVAYDTFYGMADREYDKQIGVKSTAILFEENDRMIIAIIQGLAVIGWLMIGQRFELSSAFYYLGIAVAIGLMAYQQWLIRERQAEACFKAFMNNHWIGFSIFMGIALHYMLQ